MKNIAIALLSATIGLAAVAADSTSATTSTGAAASTTPTKPSGRERLSALDTDKDQFISRDEANANKRLSARFDAIDTDKDGKLSTRELTTYGKANKAKGFASLDVNGDGSISREEAQGSSMARHFDEADTNKDGVISTEEVNAFKSGRKNAKPAV